MLTVPNPMSIISLWLLGSSFPREAAPLAAAAPLLNGPIASEQLSKWLLPAERTHGG